MNVFVELAVFWFSLFTIQPPDWAITFMAFVFFLVPIHFLVLVGHPGRVYFGYSNCVLCDVLLSVAETLATVVIFVLLSYIGVIIFDINGPNS
uniref:Uncharacterized protein n=1 Tax=Bird deltacoronavirus HKU20 TaxID=3237953 RepID=A0AB39AGE7_9NIDO